MLKRLIEVALPLKEVSEQLAREKSIRHGHISMLHTWWARRPLAACRAIVFASLVTRELGSSELRPTRNGGQNVEDTPRNRWLELIKQLVNWENSNTPHYINPARRLIRAAHKILHPGPKEELPKCSTPSPVAGLSRCRPCALTGRPTPRPAEPTRADLGPGAGYKAVLIARNAYAGS